jgi:hypothetical protein
MISVTVMPRSGLRGLKGVELVLAYKEPALDVTLPLERLHGSSVKSIGPD